MSQAVGVAVDGLGNSYVASEVIYVAGGYHTAAQITKLSTSGVILWSQNVPSSSIYFRPVGIAADPAGNAYLAATDFSAGKGLLYKYDTNGAFLGSRPTAVPGSPYFPIMAGVVFDPATSRLYGAQSVSNGGYGLMAMEFDLDLNLLSTATVYDAGFYDDAIGVAVDRSGDVYVGGNQFRTTFPYGYRAQTVKFKPHLAGPPVYDNAFSGSLDFPFFFGSAVDPAGNASVSGNASLPSDEGGEGVLVRWDAVGAPRTPIAFLHQPVSALDDFVAVAADAGGNAYVSDFSADWATRYSSVGRVIKYDARGNLLWNIVAFDAFTYAPGNTIAVDDRGGVYVAGTTGTSYSNARAVVAKYSQPQTSSLKITLGASHVQPASGISGVSLPGDTKATVEIDVVDGSGNPVSGQTTLNVSVAEVPFSGGHAHDDGRPVGTLSGQGVGASSAVVATTDANGRLFLVYASTSIGGQETISATLASDPNISTSVVMNIAIQDTGGLPLIDLSNFAIPSMRLTGSQGMTTYKKCAGAALQHPLNHWASGDTFARVVTAVNEFYDETGIMLGVNDMSLVTGGVFDICSDWQPVHKCHRAGNSVDIDRGGLSDLLLQRLVKVMADHGGQRVREGSIHFEFPGAETCFGKGGL